jgi:hypothetical protein
MSNMEHHDEPLKSMAPFRCPRTTAELREIVRLETQDEAIVIQVRAKRRNLPTSWSDLPRSRRYSNRDKERRLAARRIERRFIAEVKSLGVSCGQSI